MTNPIEALLDLASKIEDFPEDVSGTDAASTIRAATEALETRLAEAEWERVENEGALKVWRRRCGEAEARLAEADRLLRGALAGLCPSNHREIEAYLGIRYTADSAPAVLTSMRFDSDCVVNGVEIKAGTEFSTPAARHQQETIRGPTGFAASGQQTARSADPVQQGYNPRVVDECYGPAPTVDGVKP